MHTGVRLFKQDPRFLTWTLSWVKPYQKASHLGIIITSQTLTMNQNFWIFPAFHNPTSPNFSLQMCKSTWVTCFKEETSEIHESLEYQISVSFMRVNFAWGNAFGFRAKKFKTSFAYHINICIFPCYCITQVFINLLPSLITMFYGHSQNAAFIHVC